MWGQGFSLSLSEWSFTICQTPYNRKIKCEQDIGCYSDDDDDDDIDDDGGDGNDDEMVVKSQISMIGGQGLLLLVWMWAGCWWL